MSRKLIFISTMTVATILIANLTANFGHASASNQAPDQTQISEIAEAVNVLFRLPSSKTIADVLKGIKEDKLPCMTPVPPEGKSLIFYGFYNKNEEIVKACVNQCVKLGNCLRDIDTEGRTILHMAAGSTPELLQLALNNIPNSHSLLNRKESEGETPIYTAAKGLKVENVRILKEAGADISVKQTGGMTTLDYVKFWLQQAVQANGVEDRKTYEQIIEILSAGPTKKL